MNIMSRICRSFRVAAWERGALLIIIGTMFLGVFNEVGLAELSTGEEKQQQTSNQVFMKLAGFGFFLLIVLGVTKYVSREIQNDPRENSNENKEPNLLNNSLSDQELLRIWHGGLNILYRRHCKEWRKNTTEYSRAWCWNNPYFRKIVYYYKVMGTSFASILLLTLLNAYDFSILFGFNPHARRGIREPIELFYTIPISIGVVTVPFLWAFWLFRRWYPTYRQLKRGLHEGKNTDEHDSFRMREMRRTFFSWAKPNNYVYFDENAGKWKLNERVRL